MASNEVWGIDLGRSGLKAIKMRRIKNEVEITDIEIIEYDQVFESEEVDKEDLIKQALEEFKNKHPLKKEQIYVSISGQATFNRVITIPTVEPKRIKEIVSYEAQQQIPFPIEEVLWDYQLIKDEELKDEKEVMLFAVRREIINSFLANLSAVDINIDGIQIAPLSLYNFIRYDRPEIKSAVIIDIGAENTDLIIINGEKLWIRALPSAGNDITKEIQKKFNIPYAEAEKLKLKAGKGKQSKKIFDVIKPILKDIVGEIHRSVGYYKSIAKDVKFEKMIFLGNVTKLAGFEKFFSQNLQYNIELLNKLNRIKISSSVNINLFQTNIRAFAVAIGLCIQGLGLAVTDIKLLPPELEKKKVIEKQKPILATAVALLAFVPAWLFFINNKMIKESQEIIKRANKIIKPLQKKREQLNSVRNYQDKLNLLKYFINVGKDREIWIEILNAINSVYLKASEQIKKNKENKIWIIGLDIKLIENKQENTSFIKVIFKISYKSLMDPLKNRNYVIKYLRNPLERYKYKGRYLFDKRESTITIEDNKKTLFPDEPPREGVFCHVVLNLIIWFDREFLFEIDANLSSKLDNNNLEEVKKAFKVKLGNFPEIKVIKKGSKWIINDFENRKVYLIERDKEILKVYRKIQE